MNLRMKTLITACLLLVILTFAGCSQEETPYQINDAEHFTVSVKYDANGGVFTTNTSVIVDSYNISEMEKNADGQVEIALLSPDNKARGYDAFTAVNNGYFLAGWYTERVQSGGSETTAYQYSGKWDFEKDLLTVDPGKTYTSEEPVITLYAAWVPLFEIEFYDLASGELMNTMTFNPVTDGDITVPALDEETGAIEMHDFPKNTGYTFNGAYYDADGKQAVDTATVKHTGVVNYENGTAENTSMKLYVDWTEGEWYHIYNAEQFLENASVSGNYVIHADLDFTGEIWPASLMYGNFSGTIQGNGHTFSNITLEQTNNSKVNAGLFGQLTETARISDLTLKNVTFTIKSGTRVAGTCYGLLAGVISDQATVSGVTVADSTLQIDSGCYFGASDYSIGLVCGMGNTNIDYSGITCAPVGDNPTSVVITVNGNDVTVEIVLQ